MSLRRTGERLVNHLSNYVSVRTRWRAWSRGKQWNSWWSCHARLGGFALSSPPSDSPFDFLAELHQNPLGAYLGPKYGVSIPHGKDNRGESVAGIGWKSRPCPRHFLPRCWLQAVCMMPNVSWIPLTAHFKFHLILVDASWVSCAKLVCCRPWNFAQVQPKGLSHWLTCGTSAGTRNRRPTTLQVQR